MPKKEHIHIVTDLEHKKTLEYLRKIYGSMTKAVESAIDRIEIDAASACRECKIKTEFEVMMKAREILKILSLPEENIKMLNDYFLGDIPARELLIKSRQTAFEFGRKYHSFFNIPYENTYENLLACLEEYKQGTRLFKAIDVDRFSKKIIVHINDAFRGIPILATTGLIGFLESFNFTFDIDFFQADITLKWLNPEIYALEKGKIEEKILFYIKNSEKVIKPYLFKKGMVLITPELLDWFIQKLFGHYIVPSEISYTLASRVINEIKVKEDPQEIITLCVDTLRNMNISNQITEEIMDSKSFRLNISCSKPNICKLVLNGLIQILAKYGWKLRAQNIDFNTLQVVFQYVGDDPSILVPLYINNFIAYQNQQFETLRLVSEDEFDNISNALYERDAEAYREILYKRGVRIGNEIKQFDKTMSQIRVFVLQVIPQLIGSLKNPEDLSFFPEKNRFTIILKKMDLITLERIRSLILGALETFGYFNIKSTIIGNKTTFEFVRPFEVNEKIPLVK